MIACVKNFRASVFLRMEPEKILAGACVTFALQTEFAFEHIIDGLRARFAAGHLHDLTDKPSDRFRIGLRIGDLVRIFGNDVVDCLLDGADAGHLLQAALLDNGPRIAAFLPWYPAED